ncbi:uncharacterized protein LOC130973597 [Arachis stenosperma]|uniref:uncharacterized protein LOC130973597 n=1 Tax=Arachis stenosperma TaxID=217475 RepID=UPI0025ABE497|nr:uncharacterized protein LOC130973597 [Arachis stenosperma]
MWNVNHCCWAMVVMLSSTYSWAFVTEKTAVFLSPKIEIGAGKSSNKLYYDVDFPRGHIALKSFNAEIVDEKGNSVPLYEAYLHHWIVMKYHQPKNATKTNPGIEIVQNSGLCQYNTLPYYFGVGSETRGVDTHIPDPYGIEAGNPPKGYDEKWVINVHAIDTRGVQDKIGCIECRCDLFNITKDSDGKPLSPSYHGGLTCCPDESQCLLKKGFKPQNRTLYLKYTVKWVTWEHYILPLRVYVLDVTDVVKNNTHNCLVEYDVLPCKYGGKCVDVRRTKLPMNKGGYVIYGVAHEHVGGTGSTLYGQDGRVICNSVPKYGNGREAGNEKGYLVGMTTCYPKPGSIKISNGEVLTLEVDYSNTKLHSGVMGLFYLLVADDLPHHKN